MEPLSALSIACNVMQVISFGLGTISLCKKIYETGHPDLGLVESGRHLEGIGRSLTQQLKHRTKSLTAEDRAFIKIANQCADDARALQDEAAYLAPKKEHEIRGAIMATGRSLWHSKKLKKLEENLSRSQRLLETCLLERICDESQANAIQYRDDFANLDRTLQDFVKQYAEGQRTLSGLLQANFQTIKDQVTKESDTTRQEVTAHITNELLSHHKGIEDKITTGTTQVPQEIVDSLREELRLKDGMEERQRLLESLKYPETNARYNKISETCPDTFKWVFDPDISGIDSSGNPGAALLKWLKSDGRLFWISGKPGSGKSTLTKFIVLHPRTREALEQWREQTRIIHHFFWLPGSEMQNSIHGMLCSLLHQSLLEDFLTLELQEEETHIHVETTVFLQFPELKKKSSHWDWSTADLMNVLFYHLESSLLTYCFFLDGLDEVFPKDGPHRLLQVLDRLVLLPSVKLCVSSRPEHVFTTRFEENPFLRMQDLIAPDIQAYAYEVFREQTGVSVLPDCINRIIRIITDKADGVFLWAVLVLKSFRRGLSNGDTWDELQRRLDIVPMDLMDLYRDMWSRLNDDSAIYKETAALYISLIIRYKALGGIKFPIFYGKSEQLTVIDFMAASNSRSEIDDFLGQSAKVSSLDLEKKCEQTIKNINIRCAGLLNIYPRNGTVDLSRSEWWQPVCRETSYGCLLRYLLMEVDFVHRSAYDFLIDTEDGQKIWKNHGSTDFQLLCHLVKGRMARYRVLGSLAPWMHENGMTTSLTAIEFGINPQSICDWLSNATETQMITPVQAESLLAILCRASVNGDLIFDINLKSAFVDAPTDRIERSWDDIDPSNRANMHEMTPEVYSKYRLGRPWDLLALVFSVFGTFVEGWIARHSDSLTAESLCYMLADRPLEHDLEVRDIFYHPDRALMLHGRCLEGHKTFKFPSMALDNFTSRFNSELGDQVLLEVNVSFAIECVIARHFRKGKDRPALVGHEGCTMYPADAEPLRLARDSTEDSDMDGSARQIFQVYWVDK
ncbi:hypothetical protein VSDG_06406 [Cytospora chrysosperma]|uniref:NACHT domain-containing protein n=1 Tax=Cytospora chrysosperma TaxID=252740 RepID=A0A423VPB1_CYTCH|nr:hypothetical protein VSDG_06406 [Valsa sordida]